MISIYVAPENIFEGKILIKDRADINYIKNVHRLPVESNLRVVDGEKEYITKIKDISKFEILLEVMKKSEEDNNEKTEIVAAIGLTKNPKMELVIQKLSEINIDKIIPLKMERSVIKGINKKERWERIALESLKQCMRIKKIEISNVKTMDEIEFDNFDEIYVPYEQNKKEERIFSKLDNIKEKKNILYIIGPEGGFTDNEIDYLSKKGAKLFSLGNTIYRAETAAIVVGGIIANVYK